MAFEGQALPSVTLQGHDGRLVRLPDDLRGHWTLLYLYPKDFTPGCTLQACVYRDRWSDFERLGVRVYGISADSPAMHRAFSKFHRLPFPLLSDADGALAAALGANRQRGALSRLFSLRDRDTFLLDPEGVVRRIWRDVNPTASVDQTYNEVHALLTSTGAEAKAGDVVRND